MTFTQIKDNGETYINYNGIVFTPCNRLDQIKVSYHIDSYTGIEITKPTATLAILFKNPDKVDYLSLSNASLI